MADAPTPGVHRAGCPCDTDKLCAGCVTGRGTRILASCLFCKRPLVDGRQESGFTGRGPDLCAEDGDFGCDDSPETGEEGVGSHFPDHRQAVRALYLQAADPQAAIADALAGGA